MSLSASERAVFGALLPPAGGRPGLLDSSFPEFLADYRRTASFELRLGLRLAVLAATWVAPLLAGKVPPLTLYAPEDRERALAAMATSRSYLLRQMVLVLKATACFGYGADPAVRDAVGFPRQHDDPRAAAR